MSDRTQDLTNHRKVAIACKNYTDNKITELKWELGSHTLDVESDTTTAYSKSVPSGAIGCQINKVGGMSYKSENLIVLSDETTANYIIKDGVITRLTNYVDRKTANLVVPITLIANQTYYFKDFNNTTAGLTLRNLQFCSGSSVIIDFGWRKVSEIYTPTENVVIDNIKFDFSQTLETSTTIMSPAIYKSNITEFKVGFTGIRDSAVTSVVSKGANLLNLQDVPTTTTNGITYTIQNGIITLNGTATSGVNIFIDINEIILDGNYYYKEFSSVAGVSRALRYGTTTNVQNLSSPITFSKTNTKANRYLIYIATGTTITNGVIQPMLVSGTTAPTEYKPYVTPIIKPIPSEIQALTGYGWGINDTCYNYIDFDRKVFVQKVGRVDLGSLSWFINESLFITSLNDIKPAPSSSTIGNILCAIYESVSWANISSIDKSICVISTAQQVRVNDTSYTTAAAFKSAMNGVYLYYELATPVETDISAYLTRDTIDVEPNGTLEFTNTYNNDVPSDIDYLIEEVKA